jgi:hypothetical protein
MIMMMVMTIEMMMVMMMIIVVPHTVARGVPGSLDMLCSLVGLTIGEGTAGLSGVGRCSCTGTTIGIDVTRVKG